MSRLARMEIFLPPTPRKESKKIRETKKENSLSSSVSKFKNIPLFVMQNKSEKILPTSSKGKITMPSNVGIFHDFYSARKFIY